MAITITYKVYEVGVLPVHGQYENVVARVSWGAEYEDQGFSSQHSDLSLLTVDNIQSFIPIQQVTKDKIIEWCVESKGGAGYMEGLLCAHTAILKEKIAQKDIKVYKDFPVDAPPYPATPPVTIPMEVL